MAVDPYQPFRKTLLDLDSAFASPLLKVDTTWVNSLKAIGLGIANLQANWRFAMQPMFEFIDREFKDVAKAKAVEEAGWLPHPTIPSDRFEAAITPEDLHHLLKAYYRDEWDNVRERFSASVQSAGVDDEAKLAFEEALAGHEAGNYRSVVRLLFPEIERVARNTVYRTAPDGEAGEKINASLTAFREAVMHKLPVGAVTGTPFGLHLIEKMYRHLYRRVPETAEAISDVACDPVPNRHASQHGLVVYSTLQNSINMLAMTDFMFHLLVRVQGYIDKQSSD